MTQCSNILILACLLAVAACAAAGSNETIRPRKLLEGSPMGLFDGLKAVNKATKVVESHIGNGMKAGKKISKVVERQVKDVINADARVIKQVAKATDKAINAGEKAVVIGIGEKVNDFANIITAPLVGPGKGHHGGHGGAAAKEAIKTIKAVEHGKQKVERAIEKAAGEREHAIRRVTKQIGTTIDQTHFANNKVKKDAARAINKALRVHA